MRAQRTIGEAIRATAARLVHARELWERDFLQGRLNSQLAAVRGTDINKAEGQLMPRTREAAERARAAKEAWWVKLLED
jgi:hypothetical protein